MLADAVGETVLYFTGELAIHLAREYGIRPPRRRSDRRRRPRPLGVLADLLDPMDIAEADLTAKVLGSSLDQVVAMATSDGQRTPTLANTDGEPLELINAVFPVSDPDAVRRGLLLDPDFKEDDSDAEGNANFVWLGNEMSPMQAATSLAQFQEEARKRGWGEIEAPDGPRRWIRGTLHFEAGIRVEVNSRARSALAPRCTVVSWTLRWTFPGVAPCVRVNPTVTKSTQPGWRNGSTRRSLRSMDQHRGRLPTIHARSCYSSAFSASSSTTRTRLRQEVTYHLTATTCGRGSECETACSEVLKPTLVPTPRSGAWCKWQHCLSKMTSRRLTPIAARHDIEISAREFDAHTKTVMWPECPQSNWTSNRARGRTGVVIHSCVT